MRFNIAHIAFGRLVKPLRFGFGVRDMVAGIAPRGSFESKFDFLSCTRPQGRSPMEGLFDGAARFNASRYRCY